MFEKFVVPQMEGIASQIIAIETGGFDETTAKKLLEMELIHVNSVVCAVSELVALEVQNIINAALQAIAATVNGALGFASFSSSTRGNSRTAPKQSQVQTEQGTIYWSVADDNEWADR